MQVTGGTVGPVQVFDHQQDRADLRQPDQGGPDGVEEFSQIERRGRCRIGPDDPTLWQQTVDRREVSPKSLAEFRLLAREPTERLADGQIRHRIAAEVQTVPDKNPVAGEPGLHREFDQQAGLADTGIAAQHHAQRSWVA